MLTIRPYKKRKLKQDPAHRMARLEYKRKRRKMSNFEKAEILKTRRKWYMKNKHALEQKADATRRARKAVNNLSD